jgi:hypothetical protein
LSSDGREKLARFGSDFGDLYTVDYTTFPNRPKIALAYLVIPVYYGMIYRQLPVI